MNRVYLLFSGWVVTDTKLKTSEKALQTYEQDISDLVLDHLLVESDNNENVTEFLWCYTIYVFCWMSRISRIYRKKIHSFYFFQFCLPYLKAKSDKHEKNSIEKKLFFLFFKIPSSKWSLQKLTSPLTLFLNSINSHTWKVFKHNIIFSLLHFTIIWEKKSKKINFRIRNDFIIIILYTVTQI